MPPYFAATFATSTSSSVVAVARRRIDERRRHAHRAAAHRGVHDRAHPLELRRVRLARRHAEDRVARLGLAEVAAEVDADPLPLERREVLARPAPRARACRPRRRSPSSRLHCSLFSASPLRGSTPPDWSIMSIQPGLTYLPPRVDLARARARDPADLRERPSLIATSARIQDCLLRRGRGRCESRRRRACRRRGGDGPLEARRAASERQSRRSRTRTEHQWRRRTQSSRALVRR